MPRDEDVDREERDEEDDPARTELEPGGDSFCVELGGAAGGVFPRILGGRHALLPVGTRLSESRLELAAPATGGRGPVARAKDRRCGRRVES